MRDHPTWVCVRRRRLCVQQEWQKGGMLQPPDRCPFPRPFPPDFGACAAFQPVAFVAADSLNKALGTQVSCRHLAVGPTGHGGRFYARCSLGAAEARQGWVAGLGPERVEVMRALQEEFDAASRRDCEEMFAAKAAVLAGRDGAVARLDRAVAAFLQAARGFVAEREARFVDVGLPVARLLRSLEDWAEDWRRGRDIGVPQAGQALFAAARGRSATRAAQARELLGHGVPAGGREAVAEPELVLRSGPLEVRRTTDPPGLALRGEIDAGNLEPLCEVLLEAARAGGELHVDIRQVLFCDLGGLRALVEAATTPGCLLVVHGMPGHLRRALDIAGWGQLPTLVLPDEAVRP